jgi:hypothetical protein
VRTKVFRSLMADQFGDLRAEMIAHDHVLADLGGRTPDQALAAGYEPMEIYRAVCEAYEVPPERR